MRHPSEYRATSFRLLTFVVLEAILGKDNRKRGERRRKRENGARGVLPVYCKVVVMCCWTAVPYNPPTSTRRRRSELPQVLLTLCLATRLPARRRGPSRPSLGVETMCRNYSVIVYCGCLLVTSTWLCRMASALGCWVHTIRDALQLIVNPKECWKSYQPF